jgi:(2Fe-2S) ferredoxin
VTVRIRVCHDCCCGTPDKHPDVDHDALLRELIEGTRGLAEVSVTSCLLACDRSNVVVVSPGPYWFGRVLTRHTVAELVAWIGAGGPSAPLPETLEHHRIRPWPLEATAAGLVADPGGDRGA